MRLLRSLLRFCADALIAYGRCQFFVPGPELAAPGPGHPERMPCDAPLTETEKALDHQLEGVAERVGREADPF